MTQASAGARKYAPATQRNREPILEILQRVLPEHGTILEVAAGSGEHAVYFAPKLAPRCWLPSDPDPENLASIAAWRAQAGCADLLEPIALDVTDPRWPVEQRPPEPAISAVVAINLIHIAPWSAAEGLMAGAGRILARGGVLYLYGPYRRGGAHTAPSNAEFDRSLKSRDPRWGVRDLEAVIELAGRQGLSHLRTESMPANNLSVTFRR